MIADYTVSESLLCKSFNLKLSLKLNVSVKIFYRQIKIGKHIAVSVILCIFTKAQPYMKRLCSRWGLIISDNKGLFMRKQAHFQSKPPMTVNYTII